ncbi:hypothetical protein HPP92_027489 [Vanilla planifolia]|uniref:Fe2OG dioxygenase domain-containing protein n=1 Tax=Vanilla planifolia TaxID=51239 RepID=A0A835PCG4_VANPL|nr:hypothetical protein HPP92_027489 [Vanilla planifolia]
MVMKKREEEAEKSRHTEGVRSLCESGIKYVPTKYILPAAERAQGDSNVPKKTNSWKLKVATIDINQLLEPSSRHRVLESLSKACEQYGFFRVVNHGIPSETLLRLMASARRFFELPSSVRAKYMSNDIRSPVRYGTSFNQLQDGVFYWRDFLKLNCHPMPAVLPFWPSSPPELREEAQSYAKQSKVLFLLLMEAILEILGLGSDTLQEFKEGTHMVIINCFPPCPEPELTLGMPPHSDYGFLTILLQDTNVKGLQVQCGDDWVTVDPIPDSLFVNVGDHLEIFSNGRYKSVLHRVFVNSTKSRNSIASLHSLPFDSIVRPHPELVKGVEKLYEDTDFASFLNYMTTNETKQKRFLESRKVAKPSSTATFSIEYE